nr:hypothetical protein RAR13_09980 [Aminobacter aminovorans]
MFRWLKQRKLEKRAADYLHIHPEDEPAVKAIFFAMMALAPRNVWEVASITAGREISPEEWEIYGPRWERAWTFMNR